MLAEGPGVSPRAAAGELRAAAGVPPPPYPSSSSSLDRRFASSGGRRGGEGGMRGRGGGGGGGARGGVGDAEEERRRRERLCDAIHVNLGELGSRLLRAEFFRAQLENLKAEVKETEREWLEAQRCAWADLAKAETFYKELESELEALRNLCAQRERRIAENAETAMTYQREERRIERLLGLPKLSGDLVNRRKTKVSLVDRTLLKLSVPPELLDDGFWWNAADGTPGHPTWARARWFALVAWHVFLHCCVHMSFLAQAAVIWILLFGIAIVNLKISLAFLFESLLERLKAA